MTASQYAKQLQRKSRKQKQEVNNVLKYHGLKITIEANKKIVNFLDVTLDLTSRCYKPYMKPSNKLLYVHKQSNHSPTLNVRQNEVYTDGII